jgi:hypothetical protein
MSANILFLTGKLAENSLNKVLADLQSADFEYQVAQLGISVAALMTPEFIARRLPDARGADRILIPGLCRGDLVPLVEKYGVPVERGPEDLKDLPQYFGQGGKARDLSRYATRIFRIWKTQSRRCTARACRSAWILSIPTICYAQGVPVPIFC